MSTVPPKSPSQYTSDALQSFKDNEAIRARQKASPGEKVQGRILLKIVYKEQGTSYLEARKDNLFERINILFNRKDYKLENIQAFLNTPQKRVNKILLKDVRSTIDKKIEYRKLIVKPSLRNIFQKIFSPRISTQPTNQRQSGFDETMAQPIPEVDELANLINLLAILPLTSEEIPPYEAQLEYLTTKFGSTRKEDLDIARQMLGHLKKETKEATKIIPPPGANYGITNPGNACFLNATLQGLGKSPAILALLETRANNLGALLNQYVPAPQDRNNLVNLLANALYILNVREGEILVDALTEDVEVANIPEHLLPIAVLPSEAREALLQLTLVSKLQDIFAKMKTGTVDEDTIQTLRTIIICSGFEKGDATLLSQEDAGNLCVRLLDILESPLFPYKIAIDYPASFPIPSLDRQKNNANAHFVQVVHAKAGTSIQELVCDVHVEEELDKKALLGANDLELTPEEFKEIEKLPDISKISTVQSLLLTKGAEPAMLPIILKRYDEKGKKVDTSIAPSYSIDIPLTGRGNEQARYRLVGVAVHHGASVRSGHFYTYVPKIEDNNVSWTAYNDSYVSTPSNDIAYEDVATHGYVYYYEFVGHVKIGTPPLARA